MNNKFKKFIIPALAATIITGGATSAAMASAASKEKPIEQREQNEQNEPNEPREQNEQLEQADLVKKVKIKEAESIKIALEKVPGTLKDVELEDEDGTIVYGVEIKAKDGSQQDVKVDAQTGKVINVEKDDEGESGEEE
ncbi:PepSY domain-containing protein [Bacillus sp. FJAT-29790]|uniref:PepSY domain-containing protein n=1 Tax=Bacillus sp. FJAT-29790 TaxID=1895002 RepID=UPI001C2322FC|nr:PepSY domain-containing protein [Bacillus sp. FJAT-29790]MBU8880688.1 PepSY domain-containing protein [Bacillus sp. FJAT-29790]